MGYRFGRHHSRLPNRRLRSRLQDHAVTSCGDSRKRPKLVYVRTLEDAIRPARQKEIPRNEKQFGSTPCACGSPPTSALTWNAAHTSLFGIAATIVYGIAP